MQPRIGLGSDLHSLVPGTGLQLGGVPLPCDLGVRAQSDGDALLHAITDAILGALGAPDIGQLFPDADEENRDRASADFLAHAIERMRMAGQALGNLDTVVSLERPKLASFKDAMRARIADLCGCRAQQINIKAKSGEGVGPVGRGEAISVQAVVLLLPAGA